jgi:hypothetical protein
MSDTIEKAESFSDPVIDFSIEVQERVLWLQIYLSIRDYL